jgi:hypothetical protein
MKDLLEEVRMSQAWMLDAYNEYMKRKDARQITYDQFCDEYDKQWELN